MTYLRCAILALTLVLAAQSGGRAEDQKLDRMTAKLKKDCEDQGGQFQLTQADTKYTAAPLDAPVSGHPGDRSSSGGNFGVTPGGNTARKASGECVWSFHTEAVTLPPSDAPREVLHLNPNGDSR